MKQPGPVKASKITLGIFISGLIIVSIQSIIKLQTLPSTPRIEETISMTLVCLVLLTIHIVPFVALFMRKSWASNYCIALFGFWAIILFFMALSESVEKMISGGIVSLLLLWLAISLIRNPDIADYLRGYK